MLLRPKRVLLKGLLVVLALLVHRRRLLLLVAGGRVLVLVMVLVVVVVRLVRLDLGLGLVGAGQQVRLVPVCGLLVGRRGRVKLAAVLVLRHGRRHGGALAAPTFDSGYQGMRCEPVLAAGWSPWVRRAPVWAAVMRRASARPSVSVG